MQSSRISLDSVISDSNTEMQRAASGAAGMMEKMLNADTRKKAVEQAKVKLSNIGDTLAQGKITGSLMVDISKSMQEMTGIAEDANAGGPK